MFCSNCGKEVAEKANFCGSCGEKINNQNESPSVFRTEVLARNSSNVPTVICVIAFVLLLIAVFADPEYGFYVFLRFAICGSSIYLAVKSKSLGSEAWMWVLIVQAIVFNPFIPFAFGRGLWTFIDIAAGTIYFYSVGIIHGKEMNFNG